MVKHHQFGTPIAPDMASPIRVLPWADQALCAQADPELWFDQATTRYESVANSRREMTAKATCHRCPVIDECREYAMADPSLHGIWGGLTMDERKRARRRRTA